MIHVALIRGINVGGNRRIAMERLRAVHVAAGLQRAAHAPPERQRRLRRRQGEARRARSEDRRSPRRRDGRRGRGAGPNAGGDQGGARRQPACPRRRRPTRATSSSCSSRRRSTRRGADKLAALETGLELVRPGREEVYLYYPPPAGIGRSKLTGAVIEKALRTVGTARNWTTLTKILALAETLEAEQRRAR